MRRVIRSVSLALSVVVLAACGGTSLGARGPQDELPAPKDLSADDIRAVVKAVVEIRGLPEKTPVVVQVVSQAAFNAAFEKRRAAIEEERGATAALPLPSLPKESPDVYLAFYDELTRVIYMRQQTPAWARHSDIRALLAHEVTHALQDQHYSLLPLRKERDREKVSAFRAVIEGDAEVVRIAYDATLHHKPFRRAVAREITDDNTTPETMVRMGLFSPALLQVAPAQREMSIFPYISGRNFVARLFLAGGFGAVNAAYTHLPTSTEHILHPERYLAGEMPVTLQDIEVPPSFQGLAHLSFGELGTRLVLTRLSIRPLAVVIASGWAGDRVLLARGPMGETLLAWVSLWDDRAQQDAFVHTLVKAPSEGASPSLRREVVKVEGNRVVFVSGIPESEAAPIVEKLLMMPASRAPAVPPLGSLALVQPPLPLEQRIASTPTLKADESGGAFFEVEALGLRGRLRAPIEYRKGLKGGFVAASNDGTLLFVQATVVEKSAAAYDVLHQASVTGFGSVMSKGAPKLVPGARDVGELGRKYTDVSARAWTVGEGDAVTFQCVIVPICSGKAALVVASAHRTAEGEAQVKRFLSDLSMASRSTFCDTAIEEDRTDLPAPTFTGR